MSGNLEANKILGAVLATAFVILLVKEGTALVYHTEAPEKMGYFVDAPEEAEGGAAEVVLPPDWGTVLPTADLAAGEAAFAACRACHTIDAGGANGIGPGLYGVVGRQVAGHAGFAYSDAMTGHRSVDPTWSLDALDKFLTSPQRYVPGTKMSYAGVRNQETRVNLIAYLRSQGSGAFPIPAPDPSRQPGAAPAADGAIATEGAPAEGGAPATDTATTGEAAANAAGAAAAGGQSGGVPSTAPAGPPASQTSPVAPSSSASPPQPGPR